MVLIFRIYRMKKSGIGMVGGRKKLYGRWEKERRERKRLSGEMESNGGF